MVIQPYAVFAQDFSWTEPSGPPLDNNVAPPVNVGPVGQTKDGEFFIMKQGGNGFAVPFSSASFGTYLPGIFGGPAIDYPSTVNIYGNLLYRPDGTAGATPPAGQVLSTGVNGYAKWVDPATLVGSGSTLPTCTANQVLQVNQTGTWSCGTGATSATLPVGTNGQTLRYNSTMAQWEPTSVVTVTGTGPAVVGVGSGAGNSTGVINIMTSSTVPNAHIEVASPSIMLRPGSSPIQAGQVLTSTTTQGHIGWVDPITLLGSLLPNGTSGQTFVHNGTNWTATDKLTHSQASVAIPAPYEGDFNPDGFMSKITNDVFMLDTAKASLGRAGQGYVNIYGQNAGALSNNFTFTPMVGQTQNVNFFSDNVKFAGPFQNNQWDSKLGRLLFSKDDEGSIKWSRGLEYQEDFEGMYNIFGVVDDADDADDIPLLWSEGLTFLQGDTTIDGLTTINNDLVVSTEGDLFLEGVNYPSASDNVKHLCLRMSDKQVVRCEPQNVIGEVPQTETRTGIFTETFGPGSGPGVSFPRPNQAPGDVTVKICGAGGGGGGGGRGWEDGSENGHGGGGGGGGGKGDCITTDITGLSGTELTWNIGSGGTGGSPGNIDVVYQPQPSQTNADTSASSGQPGAGTQVSYEGNQIGSVLGGAGGYAGANASGSGPGVGGSGGSSNINIATAGWHKGSNGQISTDNATEMGQGGVGGKGENNVTGQGGNGGSGGQPFSGSQFGNAGQQGASGYGGGGGGGGSGKWYDYLYSLSNQQNQDNAIRNHGGWGGNGGSGYVQLTYYVYIEEPAAPTSEEFLASGSFDLSQIPTDDPNLDVTFEVWGAGGGGGGAGTATPPSGSYVRRGGGGGAGGYGTITVDRSALPNTGTLAITVGNGGTAGTITTSGGNGGQTVVAGAMSITVEGGEGGSKKVYGQTCAPVIAQGGDTISGAALTAGGDGGSCGEPAVNPPPTGYGGGGVQSVGGYGGGGVGASVNYLGAQTVAPQPGQGGRVYISW